MGLWDSVGSVDNQLTNIRTFVFSCVAKLSLKEVKCLYLRMRPLVFGGSFLKAAVRSSNMEKILRDIFQDTKMSSVTSPRYKIVQ